MSTRTVSGLSAPRGSSPSVRGSSPSIPEETESSFAAAEVQTNGCASHEPSRAVSGKPQGWSGQVAAACRWYASWALPGMGMYSEAYIIFSAGLIKVFQEVIWPECYKPPYEACNQNMVQHVSGYIQICGIIAGMLIWGVLGDVTGRKWGSRSVAAIMLSGCILLTFTPWSPGPSAYFAFFLAAQTWYGVGVGGEYPMASSSAAERSAMTPELRKRRGEQVLLVFSSQGMGTLVNASVILISMAIFGQTGQQSDMTVSGCQKVLALTYGFGAVCCLVMVVYRFVYLGESEMFKEAEEIKGGFDAAKAGHPKHVPVSKLTKALHHQALCLRYFWPRLLVASAAWVPNNFAFYGNKLEQSLFIDLLYPDATPYKKQQWTVLNAAISLLGYYAAAALVDKPWYGRARMQNVGYLALFVFNIIIYGQWSNMGTQGAPQAGVRAFQALYFLTSFFNQLGPNATTWLVAGEIIPTDVRATYHGLAAAIGKTGAILAAVWFSYIADSRKVFLVSAVWAIMGAVITLVWLPDTTGLDLEEYDRMQRYIMDGRFPEYHGEGVNPRHLSVWEQYVMGWGKQYDPHMDQHRFLAELQHMSSLPEGARLSAHRSMSRLSRVDQASFLRAVQGAGSVT